MTHKELLAAAEQFEAPLYVYDLQRIEGQYHQLLEAFSAMDTRFFYACKALSNLNILRYICRLGMGLDCVSLNEVQLGLRAGFKPENIIFTPNSVGIEEIYEAQALGVHINIDTISILEQFGHKFGGSYPIFIRLNPHILAGGNYKISTGHIDSKFGISIHQLRHILRIVEATKLNVVGLHVHTGSEIKDPSVFVKNVEILLDLVEQFPNVKYLDLGSGFKVPYQAHEKGTDVKLVGQHLTETIQNYEKAHNRKLEIWFEPGKYLVSQAGYLIAKVNQIKHTTATVFAGINSGFNHLIRPMFYDAYHHIENLSNPKGNERLYTVVGNICETDTFAWDRTINEIRVGDFLVFHNAGAYGFEMSSHFNSRFKPAEVMYLNGQFHLIRRRETLDDLLHTQLEIDF